MTKNQGPKTKSQFEHSAGGVIFREFNNNIQILLIKGKNDQWSFPKGLIEKGEDSVKTAEREIGEEVGLRNLIYVDKLDTIGYFYRFRENLIQKKVDFFLFRYDGNETPKPLLQEGISDVSWFMPKEALTLIGYTKTNKPILEEAIEKIKQLVASG